MVKPIAIPSRCHILKKRTCAWSVRPDETTKPALVERGKTDGIWIPCHGLDLETTRDDGSKQLLEYVE